MIEYHDILNTYFANVDKIIAAIYKNAGTRVSGYGFISPGYGGGIDIEQANILTWIDGFLAGLANADKQKAHKLMNAINKVLIEKYPEVNDGNVPFINLSL